MPNLVKAKKTCLQELKKLLCRLRRTAGKCTNSIILSKCLWCTQLAERWHYERCNQSVTCRGTQQKQESMNDEECVMKRRRANNNARTRCSRNCTVSAACLRLWEELLSPRRKVTWKPLPPPRLVLGVGCFLDQHGKIFTQAPPFPSLPSCYLLFPPLPLSPLFSLQLPQQKKKESDLVEAPRVGVTGIARRISSHKRASVVSRFHLARQASW